LEIPVEFEWVPPICSNCKSFGHNDVQCPTVEKWVPKKTIDANFGDQPSSSNNDSKSEEGDDSTIIEGDLNMGNYGLGSCAQDQSKPDSNDFTTARL